MENDIKSSFVITFLMNFFLHLLSIFCIHVIVYMKAFWDKSLVVMQLYQLVWIILEIKVELLVHAYIVIFKIDIFKL